MDQPVYAVFKNEEKERDYPGFAQACADWSNDPNGRKVVKLGADGNILEEFEPEECQEAARIYKETLPEKASPPSPLERKRLAGGESAVRPR